MNVIRIPTKFVRSIERLSEKDRLSVFDSLLRIGKDEVICLPDSAAGDTIQLIYGEWMNMESKNGTKPTVNHISEGPGTNSPSDPEPRVEYNIVEYNKIEESKTKKNNAIALTDKSEVSAYGNSKINDMLASLTVSVGCNTFKESKAMQRHFGNNLVKLYESIGKEEFMIRLKGVLSDPFKRKNSNSIKYLYGELKSFIHEWEGVKLEKKQRIIV